MIQINFFFSKKFCTAFRKTDFSLYTLEVYSFMHKEK